MTSIALTQNNSLATTTTPELSTALKRLLVNESDALEAAEEIAHTPALRSETVAAMPALLRHASAEAGQDGVQRVIGRRFATFPQPQRSGPEWAAWWADYYDVLADQPETALEAGMLAYLRSPGAEFMPKPGKLLELARTTPNVAVQMYARARQALAIQPRREASPEQKAAVAKLAAETAAALGGKAA